MVIKDNQNQLYRIKISPWKSFNPGVTLQVHFIILAFRKNFCSNRIKVLPRAMHADAC